jgi:hypothetical protein
MVTIPNSIEEALDQAKTATTAALKDGLHRLQVEILIPELKVQDPAHQFIPIFEEYSPHLKVYFPDPGAAALARRDWGETPYTVRGMTEPKGKIQPDDRLFFFIEPSAVEVNDLEKMCEEAGDRPVVLFIPKLESITTIGIGYAARQLRERFISTFESCYYIRPLEGAALFRCYPNPWQVWLEKEDGYELISETTQKPVGEVLEGILQTATSPSVDQTEATPVATPQRKKPGLLTNLQRFLRALSQ